MTDNAHLDDLCSFLEWDSNFFELRIARLHPKSLDAEMLERALGWCQHQRIDCLYFLASGDHPSSAILACQHGFSLVDTRLTLERSLPLDEPMVETGLSDTVVRGWQPEDLPWLKKIAAHSFTQTRFLNDPNFGAERSRSLYSTWIEVSCQGYADHVLVALHRSQPAGFISLHFDLSDLRGSIGLVGIAPALQGRGLSSRLLRAGLEWLSTQGARQVSVATQGANPAALRTYQRRGFFISSIDHWFHRWFLDRTEAV